LEVDEETVSREVLEYARFRIRIPEGAKINLAKDVKINGIVYQVAYEEESCSNISQVECAHCRWGSASEEESQLGREGSVGDDCYASDRSEDGGGGGALSRKEESAHFSTSVEGREKVGACVGVTMENNHANNFFNHPLGSLGGSWEKKERNSEVIKELGVEVFKELGDTIFNEMPKSLEGSIGGDADCIGV